MKENNFIHLRNYTQFSLSIGALRISDLIKYCKINNSPAISISDKGNLFGSMEFSLECINNGIQPIISCSVNIVEDGYESGELLLVITNEIGYKNLSKIVTFSYLESKTSTPTISLNILKKYSEGLVCLSGGQDGFLKNNFFSYGLKKGIEIIKILDLFYQENFFLEIQRFKNFQTNSYIDFLVNTSLEYNLPLIATNENYFLNPESYEAHDVLSCIAQQSYVESYNRKKQSTESYLKNKKEMIELYKDLPSAISNTITLAKKCCFLLREKLPKLPKISNLVSEENSLKEKSFEGLNLKFKKFFFSNQSKKEYTDRLSFELDVIIKMGYSGYFLIVADFIQWAKQNKIPVGPGRGSGAGSLVAWCLTITDLDPIRFGLLFERFLNPERISMPDFDIDFCMEKRDDVIKYVQKKYGYENVAQIITFGSFQPRVALRDVGRVLQIPYEQVDQICKLIPFNPANPIGLEEVVKNEVKIKKSIENDDNIKKLFSISMKIEGLLRHASTHAAGVVISDKPLNETLPLYRDPRSNFPVTQFSMKYVEKAGLVKFDFLGLKTLSVIQRTCKLLYERGIKIDIDTIPLDDSKTFDLIKSGQTIGIFQFDGKGMRETITQIKPDRFEDLIAIVSLYRPGPMDNIPLYVRRKNSNENISYIHPDLNEILDETYGIMVYQEQVMQIAKKLAGFSLAKADLLRRAMGKKIKSEMEAQKVNFINGCKTNKINEMKAEELFNEIEKFAGYGFNKSHAAAYALVSYQTAFLKTHYPLEFLSASMEYELNNPEKLSIFCNEIKSLGYEIYKPDVNTSFESFRVMYEEKNQAVGISYALGGIKNVGENSIKLLVKEREKNGKFKSLIDLLKRIDSSILNKRQFEGLIFSGSINSLESNQKYLYDNIENILQFNNNYHKNINKFQENLFDENIFDDEQFNSLNYSFWDIMVKLKKEHESIGFFLSSHPVKHFDQLMIDKELMKLKDISNLIYSTEKSFFNSIILINNFVERKSKTGKKYAFFGLSDDTFEIEAICFSEVLNSFDETPKIGDFCLVGLEILKNSDTPRLIITQLEIIDFNTKFQRQKLEIKLNLKNLDYKKLGLLLKDKEGGNNFIKFITEKDNKMIEINSKNNFSIDLSFLNNMKKIHGIEYIKKIN